MGYYSTGVERGIGDVRHGVEMGQERDTRASADGRRGRISHDASKIVVSLITITRGRERRTGNTIKQIMSRTLKIELWASESASIASSS
jgi:hypothetical protein